MIETWPQLLAILSEAECERRKIKNISQEQMIQITVVGMPFVKKLEPNLSGDELIEALNVIVKESFNIVLGPYPILPKHPDA